MSELRSSCRPPVGGDTGAMVIRRAGPGKGKVCGISWDCHLDPERSRRGKTYALGRLQVDRSFASLRMTVWIWVANSTRDTALSPSIHRLIRQPISNLVMFTQCVADFEVLEPADQLLRLIVQL